MDNQINDLPPWVLRYLLPAVGFGVAGLLAFQTYGYFVESRNKQVSTAYWHMIEAVRDENIAAAETAYAELSNKASPEQQALASLVLAGGQFKQGNYELSAGLFQSVINNSDSSGLRDIARLRLARTLILLQETTQAQTLIQSIENNSVLATALGEEIFGDAYLAANKPELAIQSFLRGIEIANQNEIEYLANNLRLKIAILTSNDLRVLAEPATEIAAPASEETEVSESESTTENAEVPEATKQQSQ